MEEPLQTTHSRWKCRQSLKRLSPVACRVLAYLLENPQAGDTLKGILDWWVPRQEVNWQIGQVKRALAELESQGLILRNGRDHYHVNPRKRAEIKARVE